MQANYRFVTKSYLSQALKNKEKIAIVDVRDSDFVGGNIPNCVHVPSDELENKMQDLLKRLEPYPKVVFHCALSRQRGPKAALTYARAKQQTATDTSTSSSTGHPNAEPNTSGPIEQEVLVLRGGFTEWVQEYADSDPLLVENYNARYWR